MKLVYSLMILAFSLSGALAAAPKSTKPNQGIFTSVNGKVQIKASNGNKTRTAKKDSTVLQGEKVITDKSSSAAIRFFDGSELQVNPDTQFAISALQKTGLQDKILKFKLFLGKLAASVQKLTTAKSSFEIEAGGVVCGVRGTHYTYSYDPDTSKVTVHVDDGTVYLNSNGHTYLFTAGQTGEFTHGKPGQGNNNNGQGNKPPPPNTNGNGSLSDLDGFFKGGVLINPNGSTDNNPISGNANNGFTDPGIEGPVKLNVNVHVGPGETVP